MSPQDLQKPKSPANVNSPSDLSNTKYSFSRQKLNEIIKCLRECGTEKVVVLPKIVVIGNQSAGKSSLIEAISKIKMPRSSGTCTRCPMEVVLSKGLPETWTCSINLRTEQLGSIEVSPFAFTKDPNKVTLLLRQAQLAILNPGTPTSQFLSLDENQCIAHPLNDKFSKNTVVVEITGADVDVTFIDLPGIISNAPKVRLSTVLR
jgi:vacuolar protein sorting-associated protein 1